LATTLDHSDAEQLEQLKAIVAEQQQRLEALEGQQLQPTEAETKQRRSTRRELLKLAGATIAGAAGSAALRAVPAAAADGDTMLSGTVRTETLGNPTGITQFGVGYGIALEGLTGYGGWGVRGYAYGSSGKAIRGYAYGGIGVYGEGFSTYGGSGAFLAGTTWGSLNEGGYGGAFATGTTYGVKASGSTAVAASGGNAGVSATSSTTGSTAVYGFSAATASAGVIGRVIGSGLTVGVAGSSGFTGVYGAGNTAGVWGSSANYVGVLATSYTGPDVKLFGTGRLVSVANITGGVYGAPTFTPTYGYLETVRGKDGSMWLSRNAGSGQAGWKKVSAVRADSDDGTGTAYKPFRAVDTRNTTGGFQGPHGTGNHTFQIANTGTGKQHIPSDANAIFGNLTVTGFTGSGWLTITPAGVAHAGSDPSTVNFGPGMQPAIANSFFIGLGTGASSGKVTVYLIESSGSNISFILHTTGYCH